MSKFWFTLNSVWCAATAAIFAHNGNPLMLGISIFSAFGALAWLRES